VTTALRKPDIQAQAFEICALHLRKPSPPLVASAANKGLNGEDFILRLHATVNLVPSRRQDLRGVPSVLRVPQPETQKMTPI
jgi:hypothetical protein